MRLRTLLAFSAVAVFVLFVESGDSRGQDSATEDAGVNVLSIVGCDDESLAISEEAKAALMSAGFTKCAMPFGVLIGADKDMPDARVKLAINIVAEMLDQDRDGRPDDESIVGELRRWKDRGWLAMPMDHEKWANEQVPKFRGVLGYDLIIPDWWMRTDNTDPKTRALNQISDPLERVKALTREEVTHFIIQIGYSVVYPAQFGMNDRTSVIARETKRAACDWWQHLQNDCPDSPAEVQGQGSCSSANCDVSEFYQQVLSVRAGMRPGWYGIGFPRTKEELEPKLSQEMKAILDDPKYHQINKPLTYDYVERIGAR